MSEQTPEGLRAIRRALLSVSDKTGIVEFARELEQFNVEIISTGGTARALREAGIAVRDIAEVTGFPEMMDGRVKTLHPRIHGGLLALRESEAHNEAMRAHGIEPIDLVVVNLYPFEQTIARAGVTLAEAVEQIDIGGPAMIRSAAKNWRDVAVIVAPESYPEALAELRRNNGALSLATRGSLACRAFERTGLYDMSVFGYLSGHLLKEGEPFVSRFPSTVGVEQGGEGFISYMESPAAQAGSADSTGQISGSSVAIKEETSAHVPGGFPESMELACAKVADLRYGENPHQLAALYGTGETGGVASAEVLAGKEMSFNNYVDAEAAWMLVNDFDETACAIIKHTNPAGVALGATPEEAYRRALATDPVSAFGGIVAFNRTVSEAAARAVTEIFTEVIVAPGYEEGALEILRAKKNLRVLSVGAAGEAAQPFGDYDYKKITGGLLVQTRDTRRLTRAELRVVSSRAPTDEEVSSLLFAWTVCKHTKSNAIVYARAGQTVGVGAGQMSRVDSVRIGAMRAVLPVRGSVLASDAFFPFRDGIDEAAQHGITAIIQPGGSVRDQEVIAAADEYKLAMVLTGVRHFKH